MKAISAESAMSARLMHARTAAAAQSSFDMLPPGAHERALPAGLNAGGLFYSRTPADELDSAHSLPTVCGRQSCTLGDGFGFANRLGDEQ